jgi:hypothetical protein
MVVLGFSDKTDVSAAADITLIILTDCSYTLTEGEFALPICTVKPYLFFLFFLFFFVSASKLERFRLQISRLQCQRAHIK